MQDDLPMPARPRGPSLRPLLDDREARGPY